MNNTLLEFMVKSTKVAIIGQGFVGTALKDVFSLFFTVNTYDKFKNDLCTHKELSDAIDGCSICFVCLPTPMKKDGSCDTSIVENVVEQICDNNKETIIVIKSTVPPNTTKALAEKYEARIVFNPEFLVERTAKEDFCNTKRVILGGDTISTTKLKQFYSRVFPKAHIVKTDSTTAEMVKYLTNAFLASKVSIANEMYNICQSLSIDYDKVIEYSIQDERLGYSHWAVPGPDGKFGFGGSCFPKDINAILCVAKMLSVDTPTLEGAWQTNISVRPEKDWEELKGRAVVE